MFLIHILATLIPFCFFNCNVSWSICLQCGRPGFKPWVRKIPWRREWQPILVFLPGEFHGQRSLAGYSPWDTKELDTTQWLTFLKSSNVITITFIWRKVLHRSVINNSQLSLISEKRKWTQLTELEFCVHVCENFIPDENINTEIGKV